MYLCPVVEARPISSCCVTTMDFFDAVNKRKSIRTYIPDKFIPEKDLNKILEAAMLGPSAKNLQGYKVYVAGNKESVHKIFSCFHNQRSDFINNASAILIFCVDSKQSEEEFGEKGKKLYAVQDTTIAACIAILSATALGYATCWVGNFDENHMKDVLNTDYQPITAILIGYSLENPPRKPRKEISSVVINI